MMEPDAATINGKVYTREWWAAQSSLLEVAKALRKGGVRRYDKTDPNLADAIETNVAALEAEFRRILIERNTYISEMNDIITKQYKELHDGPGQESEPVEPQV
jgi:hypothetical protein